MTATTGGPAPGSVEELIELEAIRSVRRLYSHHFDSGDIDSLALLFAEDAVCEFGRSFGGDWVGREAIRAGYQAQFDQLGGESYASLHAVANAWVVITGPGTATGRHYLLDFVTTGGPEVDPLRLLGVYDDTYVKRDGRWLIERTHIDFIWPRRKLRSARH